MDLLEVKNLSCGYGKEDILKGISFSVADKEFLGIIGPNGAGKTTLFRALTGILKPRNGEVLYKNRMLSEVPRKEIAREIAVLPQSLEVPFSFTVEEFIAMGRFPYRQSMWPFTQEDKKAIERAMELAGVQKLKERMVNQLSGGERQRVFFAQAIAQEPKLMLLDEPTTHLDIKYQMEIMELIDDLNKNGITIIVILHDLNMAAEYCKRIILLKDGKIHADGTPDQVVDYKIIEDAYNTVVIVKENPISKKPYIVLVSKNSLDKKTIRVEGNP